MFRRRDWMLLVLLAKYPIATPDLSNVLLGRTFIAVLQLNSLGAGCGPVRCWTEQREKFRLPVWWEC